MQRARRLHAHGCSRTLCPPPPPTPPSLPRAHRRTGGVSALLPGGVALGRCGAAVPRRPAATTGGRRCAARGGPPPVWMHTVTARRACACACGQGPPCVRLRPRAHTATAHHTLATGALLAAVLNRPTAVPPGLSREPRLGGSRLDTPAAWGDSPWSLGCSPHYEERERLGRSVSSG